MKRHRLTLLMAVSVCVAVFIFPPVQLIITSVNSGDVKLNDDFKKWRIYREMEGILD